MQAECVVGSTFLGSLINSVYAIPQVRLILSFLDCLLGAQPNDQHLISDMLGVNGKANFLLKWGYRLIKNANTKFL